MYVVLYAHLLLNAITLCENCLRWSELNLMHTGKEERREHVPWLCLISAVDTTVVSSFHGASRGLDTVMVFKQVAV